MSPGELARLRSLLTEAVLLGCPGGRRQMAVRSELTSQALSELGRAAARAGF